MHPNQANAMMEKAAYAKLQAQYANSATINQIGPPSPFPDTVIAAACMEFDKNRQSAAEIACRLERLADRLWGCETESCADADPSPAPSGEVGEVGEMMALSIGLDNQMARVFRALNRVERV